MKNIQVVNIKTTTAYNPAYCTEILKSKAQQPVELERAKRRARQVTRALNAKMKNKNLTFIIIISGLVVSALHFCLSIVFMLYFGLGMDPTGAEFTTKIFMQPGTIINTTFEELNPVVVNGFFYFLIGVAFSYVLIKRKNRIKKF